MKKPTNAATAAAVVATDPAEAPDASAPLATAGTPAAETPPSSPATTPAPIAGDRPARGGSYILQGDGTLVLREETKEPSLIERVAAEAENTDNG